MAKNEADMSSSGHHGVHQESPMFVYARIAVVVSLYWFVSITMVFLNKQILSGSKYSIDAPLFITWFQCLTSLSITIAINFLVNSFRSDTPSLSEQSSSRHQSFRASLLQQFQLPPLHLRFNIVKKIVPLTFVFIGMITFNNLCLKNLGVAFYFVGRSLTTVFNVLLSYVWLSQPTSWKACACCAGIVLGFFLGIDQENVLGSLSVIGLVYGVLASLFVSFNSIMTSKGLAVTKQSVWLLAFYNNLIAVTLFIPLMWITGEFTVLANRTDLMFDHSFWSLMLLSGVCGFGIGYVTMLQIKFTSPLTHNISGTAKACAQTVMATFYFGEVKTFWWWVSNMLVLTASALYARVRQVEMMAKQANKVSALHQVLADSLDKEKLLVNEEEGEENEDDEILDSLGQFNHGDDYHGSSTESIDSDELYGRNENGSLEMSPIKR